MKITSIASIVLGVSVAVGCTEEEGQALECPMLDSNKDCMPANADARPYFLTPTRIYTGVNGRDSYQSVLTANFGDFTVTSANEGIVCAGATGCLPPGSSGIIAVLTSLAAGSTTVTVESGAFSQDVEVYVQGYTTDQYDLGKERYQSPANANETDRVACVSCHSGQGGAPHTPVALAGKSDEQLLSSIVASQYPNRCENNDGYCDCTPVGEDCSACAEAECRFDQGYILSLQAFGGGEGDHKYDLTAEEANAMMGYMRAIKPEGL